MNSAIIVGSGLSGLAAAYGLKKAGWQVKVLEAENRVCGRVNAFEKDGYLIDGGPTAVSETYVDYIALMRELDLADHLIASSNQIGLVRDGHLHVIDTSRPVSSFIRTKAFSWSEKFQLLVGMPGVLRAASGVQATDVRGQVQHDAQSISGFLQGRFSPVLIEHAFDPMARVVTLCDKNDTSCLELFAGLAVAAGKLVNVRGGLETLPRALANEVDVQLDSKVSRVEKSGAGVVVEYQGGAPGAERHSETATACVITSPFYQAVGMCPQLGLEGPALARQTRSAPCYVVHLGYAAATRANPYVVALPSSESPHISAIFLEHNKAPDRAPKGHSLIMIYYCPTSVPTVSQWSPEQMLTHSRKCIEEMFPELAGKLDMHNIKYFDRASHYGGIGYYKAVKEFFDNRDAADPIQIAGDYLSIPGQETAVSWGNRAAANLIKGEKGHGATVHRK